MPKIASLVHNDALDKLPISLKGAAIFHTAISRAGFGPTSSNKEEIENAMGIISKAGVRIHMGKGCLKQETIYDLAKYNAIYIVVPPVSALLQDRMISKRVAAFKEEGIEALFELTVRDLPGIIAAAKGKSIFYS